MILGASVLQLPAITQALDMGLDVVVVDMNPNAVGFEEPGIVKAVVSTIDKEAVLQVAQENRIDGIMTLASDMPMQTVAYVSEKMHLVGPDSETALKATNKAYMRDALKAGGVPIPFYQKVSNEAEYAAATARFPESFIVKPADSSGSRGICLVTDAADKQEVADAYVYAKQYARSGTVLVEEVMRGPEVSVETMSLDGKCFVIQITDKLTTGAPHFVETGHSQPSALALNIKRQIEKAAIAANAAIGIRNGPSHTEIIVTKDGPKIVEIGARLGGDCITTHLTPLSTGVNMVRACIEIALGIRPQIGKQYDKGAAIRYFRQIPGQIQSVDFVDQAKKMRGIREISIVHGVGETVGEICDSTSRMGFVIAQDDTAAEAIRDCEEALDTIHIDII